MSKVWSVIKGLLISVWLLFAIIATICLISFNEFSVSEIGNHSIFIIDSDRLEPTFKEYDLVIAKKVSQNKYKEGDFAFFYLENPADAVFINYGQITKHVQLLIEKKRIDILSSENWESDIKETNEYVDLYLTEEYSKTDNLGVDLFNIANEIDYKYVELSFRSSRIRIRIYRSELCREHQRHILM